MNLEFLEAYIKEILLEGSEQDDDQTTSVSKWIDKAYHGDFSDAAKRFGVSKSHLYKIARGGAVPSMQLAMKIKSAGASIADIEKLAKRRSKKKKRYSGHVH